MLKDASLSEAEKEFVILKGDACVIVGRVGLARGGNVGKPKPGFITGESVGCAGVCVNFVPGGGGGHVSLHVVYMLLQKKGENLLMCNVKKYHRTRHLHIIHSRNVPIDKARTT